MAIATETAARISGDDADPEFVERVKEALYDLQIEVDSQVRQARVMKDQATVWTDNYREESDTFLGLILKESEQRVEKTLALALPAAQLEDFKIAEKKRVQHAVNIVNQDVNGFAQTFRKAFRQFLGALQAGVERAMRVLEKVTDDKLTGESRSVTYRLEMKLALKFMQEKRKDALRTFLTRRDLQAIQAVGFRRNAYYAVSSIDRDNHVYSDIDPVIVPYLLLPENDRATEEMAGADMSYKSFIGKSDSSYYAPIFAYEKETEDAERSRRRRIDRRIPVRPFGARFALKPLLSNQAANPKLVERLPTESETSLATENRLNYAQDLQIAHEHEATGSVDVSGSLKKREFSMIARGSAQSQVRVAGSAQLASDNGRWGAYAKGEAIAGVYARGHMAANANLADRTFQVRGGGSAFAGVKAEGSVEARALGSSVLAAGEIGAGIGITGRVSAGCRKGVCKSRMALGLWLGIGGSMSVTVMIDFGAAADLIIEDLVKLRAEFRAFLRKLAKHSRLAQFFSFSKKRSISGGSKGFFAKTGSRLKAWLFRDKPNDETQSNN